MIKARKNISDHIYDIIKNDIIEGNLNFGSKIIEIDYSNKLNVSRTPLREAIKKLEIEGIIERLPNGRLKIMHMTVKRIEEMFKIRMALEDILLDAIASSGKAQTDIEENLSLTNLQLHAENWDASRRLFSEYNDLLYKSSGLEFTIKVLKNYDFIISKLRKNSLKNPERMKEAYSEHLEIFKNIKGKNLSEAKRINKIHLINAKNSILTSFNDPIKLDKTK